MTKKIPKELVLQLENLSSKEKFELIYCLATGLFEVKELPEYQQKLSRYVKDEIAPFGCCYKAFEEIENLLKQVKDMEFDLRKESFMDGGIAYKLHEQIDAYTKFLSEKIFEYGLNIGKSEGSEI